MHYLASRVAPSPPIRAPIVFLLCQFVVLMGLSAIPQVDSATDFLGDHPGRVVKVRSGGVGNVEIRLEKLMQVMSSC
jgi:hypothetical protein